MSHNTHLVPWRVRGNKDLSMDPGSQANMSHCRKRRRHAKNLLSTYARRSRAHKWLETHLWHAKRMKMQNKWGYRLAMTPNDKSTRACYRFARHNSAVYDMSYYHTYFGGVEEGNSA
jgi:ribonuclease P/MRP protein subunit POP1